MDWTEGFQCLGHSNSSSAFKLALSINISPQNNLRKPYVRRACVLFISLNILCISLSLSLTVALRVGCKSRSMNFFAIKRAIPSPSFFESKCRFYDMFHKDMGQPPSYKPLQQSKRAGGGVACRAVLSFNWVFAVN